MAGLSVEAVAAIPEGLRRAYLASLPEPQELFVEQLVAVGQAYVVLREAELLGYFVVADDTMVEFHVDDAGLEQLPELFALALSTSGATKALCKSFDARMVTAAASRPATTRTVGLLFRRTVDVGRNDDQRLRARHGTAVDIEAVWSMHDGFFDDRDEIERYALGGRLFLYETTAGELVGCGILTRVIAQQNAVDVGMVVAAAHRGSGHGAYIVAHLRDHCLQHGDRPICGCSADNRPSRRALENAGFATAHSLIEFAY